MPLPLQISFRHMAPSPTIESMVRTKAAKLERFARDIVSCRVVVEPAGKHHVHGNLYQVHVQVALTGTEIAVTREPGQDVAYKDLAVATRDAFDAARRQLQDYVRRRRGATKVHEVAVTRPSAVS